MKIATVTVKLTEEIAGLAGEIDVERERKVPGWGLADSIVLAKARVGDGRVVTGDKPFIDLKDETVLIQ
ncbi:MAG: hypothetical protein QW057_08050 [Candidatus Bathyarchaeia archaeon]